MELPNYFLADLPAEAELTAGLITEACQTLKRNRRRYLETRSADQIIHILDTLGQEWLSADFPFRQRVMEEGPAATGFSQPILAAGLDSFFNQLTSENLEALLRQELGHPQRLDTFQPDERGVTGKRTALARGPTLLAHIAPGNIPNPVMLEMVLGLLTRSAQFVKCASGATFVPRMFAHSLYEADHKLGSCLEVAEWKGGAERLEEALFAEADCIAATGSDEMLAAISRKIPRTARLVGYGTRVSFGYITREALDQNAEDIVHKAATDVTAWDQRGCLSPHVIYVEDSGKVTAEAFAALLAGRLEAVEKTHPRGMLKASDSAAIATRRSFYEVRAAHSLETKMWASLESTVWTVILESDPRFQTSCTNRFIYIKSVADLAHALTGAELVQDKVSTVGMASTREQGPAMALRLAQWGARRICPLGEMQNPPLGWRHDGRPPLGDLVTWVDWEKP
jgi:hypothetical protein